MKALTVLSLLRGLRVLVSAVRDWRWGAVLVRLLVGGVGLVVLGVLGRSALARDVLSSSAAAGDAGASTPPSSSVVAAAPASVAPQPPASSAPSQGAVEAAAVASASAAPLATHGRATPDDPVYLNQATVADLHRLPGVGPKRAEAIVALRNKLGHFRQVEDLLKVKGIGRSSLKKLRPLVRLDPPPSAVADAGPPRG